jgi:hypothetical protein
MRRAMPILLIVAGLLAGGAGCAQTRKFEPTVDPGKLTDIQFLSYLETVPVITFEEGCRAVLICADGKDAFKRQDARYAELKRRGWVRDAWQVAPGDTMDVGTMCYMVSKACDLKPSLASLALGSWGLGDRRYAIRQCVAEGIIGPTPAYRPVTGSVMVWTMNKVDDYLAAHGAYQRPPGDPLADD